MTRRKEKYEDICPGENIILGRRFSQKKRYGEQKQYKQTITNGKTKTFSHTTSLSPLAYTQNANFAGNKEAELFP